jgi:hypothetical protein
MSQISAQKKPKALWLAPLLMIAGGLLLIKTDWQIDFFTQKNPDGWLIFVEEFDERGGEAYAGYNSVINNPQWRESLRKNGVNFRIYDEEQKEAESFLKVVGNTRPAYVVGFPTTGGQDVKLKVVDFGPAPSTIEDANAIISKWIK